MGLLAGEGYPPAFMGDPFRGGVCTVGVLGMGGPGLGCCHCGCVYMTCPGGDACNSSRFRSLRKAAKHAEHSVCATALGHPCCVFLSISKTSRYSSLVNSESPPFSLHALRC